MPFEPSRLVEPSILQLKPYQPGKPISEVQKEYGLKDVIKIASNENPLGFSPLVKEQLLASIQEIVRYPDGSCLDLKAVLAKHLGKAENQLIIGNGSEDVLRLLLQAFVWGDKHLLISAHAFIAYRILARGLGIGVKEIPDNHFQADLNAIAAAVTEKTGMIILANPNNPTGTYVNEKAFIAFMDRIPEEVLVVCDEAYFEYVVETDYPQTLLLQARYPNLICTRTFSKVYGLAGLRIGYGIAHEAIIELVNRIRQPFNVNHLGQVAAMAALRDQTFVQKCILLNEQGKKQYYEKLTALGIDYIPTGANFILVALNQSGSSANQALLKQGIIIRPLEPYGLENYIRITIGTYEENAQCLSALEKLVLKEKVV